MEDIIKGRTKVITVPVTQSGVVLDLTGYEAKLTIALGSGVTPVLTKAGVISTPATGVMSFTLNPSDTKDIEVTNYKVEVNIWKTADKTKIYPVVRDSVSFVNALVDDPTV